VSRSAEIVAWTCFVVGIVLLLAGVLIGLALTFRKATKEVQEKMRVLRGKVDELKDTAINGSLKASADEQAASAAETKAAEVKSTLDEVSGIVGALPENLRFAGLLVLVGTALMSVATVQFGGHSLF
jgi:Tfp pilus assembly protein PilO